MLTAVVSIDLSLFTFSYRSIFSQDINEAKVLAAANQFVSLGLKAAGYQYINIDVSMPSIIS